MPFQRSGKGRRRQAAVETPGGRAATSAQARSRRRAGRRRRARGKGKRLVQAALFAAVRGAAYALGGTLVTWFIYWLTQR